VELADFDLQGASEKVDDLKGHDFSRAAKATKGMWALAPEGKNG
jgi:hypothetical protein